MNRKQVARDEAHAIRASSRNGVEMIHQVQHLFKDYLYYRTYHLNGTKEKYAATRVSRFTKLLKVTTKSNLFDASQPISTFSFLKNFESACDSKKIHEGAAVYI